MESATAFQPNQERLKQTLGQIDQLLRSAHCQCGHGCIQRFDPRDLYRLRQMFVFGRHNSDEIDNQLKHYFHLTVNPHTDKGQYYLAQQAVCKEAFLKLLGIDEKRFDRCYKEFLEEVTLKDLSNE